MGSGADTPVLTFANGLSGDPVVHCHYPANGRCFMFDLGSVDAFSHRSLLKARQFFISHTHIDHFIGFDRILRINIPHRRLMTFAGPVGLVNNVHGKLRGYTWNLLDPGQLSFQVIEIGQDGGVRRFRLSSDEQFQPVEEAYDESGAGRVLTYEDGSYVQAVVLDHGIPSVAYRFVAPARYQIDAEALAREGLMAGPWLQDLQRRLAQHQDGEIEVDSRVFRVFDLRDKLTHLKPERGLTYITDIGFDAANLQRLKMAFVNTHDLICEAAFRDADVARAFSKKHLTTRQAAMIGVLLGARQLHPFHFSQIYQNTEDEHAAEAHAFFYEMSGWDAEQLSAAIAKECQRHA